MFLLLQVNAHMKWNQVSKVKFEPVKYNKDKRDMSKMFHIEIIVPVESRTETNIITKTLNRGLKSPRIKTFKSWDLFWWIMQIFHDRQFNGGGLEWT